jgi:hypothetical protein
MDYSPPYIAFPSPPTRLCPMRVFSPTPTPLPAKWAVDRRIGLTWQAAQMMGPFSALSFLFRSLVSDTLGSYPFSYSITLSEP